MLLDAEAAAVRAGAVRVVEREQPRLDLGDGEAGHRAGEFFREQDPLGPALVVDLCGLLVGLLLFGGGAAGASAYSITARPSASFSAVSKLSARRWPMSGRTTMRSTTTSMSCGEFLVERRRLGELVERAVDLDALEALLEVLGELLAVLALAAAHDRRQQIEPRALGQRQHAVDHLRRRSGSRSAGRSRASRARRRAPTAGACSRRSR